MNINLYASHEDSVSVYERDQQVTQKTNLNVAYPCLSGCALLVCVKLGLSACFGIGIRGRI